MATRRNTLSPGRLERIGANVVVVHSPHGPDFVRICILHRWASTESVYRADLPTCPHCELQKDDSGHHRFDEVQQRLMPEGARA